jgi:phosphinothricin acetyltransferase
VTTRIADIRLANDADAVAVLAIYAPIVRDTAISFELLPPSVNEMRERIETTLTEFPWLVAEHDHAVLGYAYASQHRERAAYQWSVDVSVYVNVDARGKGVARALYSSLLHILEELSYCTAFAGIALPNEASVGFHEAMGFTPVGIYRSVGYKLGTWHDVGWWQLVLRDYPTNPVRPRTMREYRNDANGGDNV